MIDMNKVSNQEFVGVLISPKRTGTQKVKISAVEYFSVRGGLGWLKKKKLQNLPVSQLKKLINIIIN